jgi:hypothetical protein
MNCREARNFIVERSLEPQAPGTDVALRRHLERCEACAAEALVEHRLKTDFAFLREECPHAVDVKRRVMRAVAGMGGVERELVPARQIAWGAAAAIACSLGLLGILPSFWHQLSPLMAEMQVLLVAFGNIAADLAAPVLTLLSLPLKLAVIIVKTLAGFGSLVSRLEPAAVTAITIGSMAMTATIALVVGRDLKRPAPAFHDANRKDS